MLGGLQPRCSTGTGQLTIVGALVSIVQLMVWTQTLELVQASVALYVRRRVAMQPLVWSSLLHVMTGVLQLSIAATLFVLKSQSGMLVGLQPRFTVPAGHLVNVGASESAVQVYVTVL